MSDVAAWSQTDSANSDPSPNGWPEGMDRDGVNNSARANMGASRRAFEDPQWVNLNLEDDGSTVAFVDDPF